MKHSLIATVVTVALFLGYLFGPLAVYLVKDIATEWVRAVHYEGCTFHQRWHGGCD